MDKHNIAPVRDATGCVVGHAELVGNELVLHLTAPSIAAWSAAARRLTVSVDKFTERPAPERDRGEEIQRNIAEESRLIHKHPDPKRNPWQDATDADRALEFIRRAAWVHYIGGAFDPEHMRDIANLAADALCGTPMPAPTPWESIKAAADEHWERLRALVEDE